MDRERIDELLESEGLDSRDVEETRDFAGGVMFAFAGDSQPFHIPDQESHFIGYEDDRDHVMHVATGIVDDVHVSYVVRHTSLVNAFEPEDRYDGTVWIGDAAPSSEVIAHMTSMKHLWMLNAAQTWMLHGTMMLDQLPSDVTLPSSMASVLETLNRRFARSLEA